MLRIAREFADVLAKPVVVIRQAVFPDLARLWREQDPRFKTLYMRLGLLGGAIALVVVLLISAYGKELLDALVGAEYVYGAPLLTWLMFAAAVELVGATLRPAAYAMGAASGALRVQLVTAACHVALFVLLVLALGLTGAGIAAAVASVLLMAGMLWLVATYASRSPSGDSEMPR